MKRSNGASAVACRPGSHVTLQITPCGATGRRERTERCGRCGVACVHRQEGSGIVLREALTRRVANIAKFIRDHRVCACTGCGKGKPNRDTQEVDALLKQFVEMVGTESPEQISEWLFLPPSRTAIAKIVDQINDKIGGKRPVRLTADESANGHVGVIVAEFRGALSHDLRKVH